MCLRPVRCIPVPWQSPPNRYSLPKLGFPVSGLILMFWHLSFSEVFVPCSGRVGRRRVGLWPRDMSDVRDSPFYRPLDLSDTVRMRVVLTRAVSPGRRCPTPSSYSHSGNRTCRTAPSPAAGMALAVVLPPVAPVASSSVKACPWTGEPRTQDMSLFMGVNVGEIFAFSSKMSGRLRGREILRPFRDKCVQFRLPLGWNRPSGVDSAGLLGVDSALWGGLGRSPPFRLNPSRHFEWAILSQGVPSGSGVVHCV